MASSPRDVLITGVGLVSSLGEGLAANLDHLIAGLPPVIDRERFAPYPIHPLVAVDFDKQIPKRGEQRQMGLWQRIGTYAAGLALADAGIAGNKDILGRIHMVVAAAGGERDETVDTQLLAALGSVNDRGAFLNERLMADLRPTLFLAQLSNLLAGNIAIVHGVVGSSRTFMGEEQAGVDALRIAFSRIAADQGDVFLVGGALSAERKDTLLLYGLGGHVASGEPGSAFTRDPAGFVLGSMGAFLVLESRAHAEARGAGAVARLAGVAAGRSNRSPGSSTAEAARLAATLPASGDAPLDVISGLSGTEPARTEEIAFLDALGARTGGARLRATTDAIGHGLEAAFPANVAIAAGLLARGAVLPKGGRPGEATEPSGPPRQTLVTSFGHWRGEGLALLAALDDARDV